MHSIEDRIQEWREALNSQEVCDAADLDELELHLREEITNLTDTGLSPAEAFMVASGRIGDVSPLAQEFAKVKPNAVFRKRLLWMSIGVLGYMLASYCATGLSKCAALLAVHGGLRGYGLGLLMESIRIGLLIGTVLALLCLLRRHTCLPKLPRWLDPLRNKIMLLVGVAVLDIALILGPTLFAAVTARMIGAQEFGKISIVAAYVNFFLPIVASFILVVLVIRLSTAAGKAASA